MQSRPPPITLGPKKRRDAPPGDAKGEVAAPSRKGQAEGPADKPGGR